MRIFDWNMLDTSARDAVLARPQPAGRSGILRFAREAIDLVRRDGDAALHTLTRRFNGSSVESLGVSAPEFAQARSALSAAKVAALERAIDNVTRFHATQVPKPFVLEVEDGVRCEQITRAFPAVGLYVPAGTAPLPSTVIMLAVPARLAGCPLRALCTPPRNDGSADPAVLVAAELCGIDLVFKVGGAQAIAALAYGTTSIPKVDKIFGPGNAWVTAAKQLVSTDPRGAVCDMPAGPSEVLVVADVTARADFVAADLLAQAEHDRLSQAILVTDSAQLARAVAKEIEVQRAQLTRAAVLAQSLKACRCLLVRDLEAALDVANMYAPEHLILEVKDPRHWLPYVQNAGSVFLGPWSPEPLGDYCSGTNHVLPTYGYARALSGLSVRDFLKVIPVQECSPAGLASLGPTAVALAELEGLDAHARAVTRRLEVIGAATKAPRSARASAAAAREGEAAVVGS
jgi:histidinol dehydrogenase